MPRLRLVLRGAAIGLVALAVLAGTVIVMFSHQLLTVDSGNVKADALVVLGGGGVERPERAAELFQAGAAPKIVVSGRGDCKSNAQLLGKSGVPASAVTLEDRSISTLENAKLSIPLLRQMGAHHVIIVTTWYHSRRALACFRHFAPDITFYSRPSYFGYPLSEWNRKDIRRYIIDEYIKTLGYWARYGVRPF